MTTKIKSQRLLSNNRYLTKMPETLEPLPLPIKGEGCGNTFLIFDCLDMPLQLIKTVIKEAHPLLIKENRDDALILVKEFADDEKLILKMIVLEPDGSIAEFCGNGARVVCSYLHKKFSGQKIDFYLKTLGGNRKIWAHKGLYHVEMGKTLLRSGKNKFFNPILETFQLGLGMKQFTFYWTETMEPHLVTFDSIEEDELQDLGLYLNLYQRSFFPWGINLNRAKVISKTSISVITFERGVNRITKACGTGSTSCVMLAKALGQIDEINEIEVFLKGGKIMIYPNEENVIMVGPAETE